MSVADIVIEAAAGGGGGGIILAIINGVFNRGGKRSEAAKTDSEAHQINSSTWRQEAHEVFEKIEKQCENCEKLLSRFRIAFYDLLDDLNELDGTDVATLRAQVRSAARRARAAADWEGKP